MAKPVPYDDGWSESNEDRRIELLKKEHFGPGLDASEKTEFEQLQVRCGQWQARHFPMPWERLGEMEQATKQKPPGGEE